MKVLASLFRVVCSIIVLLLLAFYLQSTPTISLNDFCQNLDTEKLLTMLSTVNAVTISLVVILLLGIFPFLRILKAVWNVLFCVSILILLIGGLYVFFGPGIALPHAIYHNVAVNQACQATNAYEVPMALTVFIFAAGWFCAPACGRVAITTVVSFGLWYALTEFLTYIVHLWGSAANPGMPEALHMIQSTPWVIAAVPAAFFLIYALLMAFFETYISTSKAATKPAEKESDKQKADSEKKPEEGPKPTDEKKAEPEKKPTLKPAEPAAKSQPILKAAPASPAPLKKLKLATPATAEKPEAKPATATKPAEPKAEEKPAETKAEEKPAEPKTEEKPAETKTEEKPAEPKTEEKSAETKTEEKPAEPKAEEKPAEPKAEEKPAEPKTEEKPAEPKA